MGLYDDLMDMFAPNPTPHSQVVWQNFRTQMLDSLEPFAILMMDDNQMRDYVPQDAATQATYFMCRGAGLNPIEAMIATSADCAACGVGDIEP